MMFARVLVGLVALVICLAGIGWYAVYLFSPDSRDTASASTSTPMKMHPAYARRQNKRSVIGGSGAIIGGLVLVPEAIDSIRTGIPIHTLNGPDIDGRTAFAVISFVIVLGAWLAASGLAQMMGNAEGDR
jgi:hypothetical protein